MVKVSRNISKGIMDREKKLQHFKESLPELSVKLIALPFSEIDSEIERIFHFVAKSWDFDQVALIEFSDGRQEIIAKYIFDASLTGQPLSDQTALIPWLTEKLHRNKTVAYASLPDGLPEDVKTGQNLRFFSGLKSILALPLAVGKSDWGAFFCASGRSVSTWSDELIKMIQYVGELVANEVERKRAAEQLDELMRFEHLLSNVSATYINLPAADIKQVIRDDLGRLGRFLGADWCGLYVVGEDKKAFKFQPPFAWWPDEDNELIMSDRESKDWGDFYESLEYSFDKWRKGESICLKYLDELPPEAKRFKETLLSLNIKSTMSVPISLAGTTVGALVFSDSRHHRNWQRNLIPRIRLFGEVFFNALARKHAEEREEAALSEIKMLKDQIEADYLYLKQELNLTNDFCDIIGNSDALKRVLVKIEQVANTNVPILILGETGTGKGLIARAIHNVSDRKDRPLVQVNCATLSPSLIESELFGHEKGSFTSAHERHIGRFELARGTTLFLDEIGEFTPKLQAKLLRVLQDGEFERVGGNSTIRTDARVLVATNRNLQKEVEAGRFRADLYYRLGVFPITIPPLRERLEDIPLLVTFFFKKYGTMMGKKFEKIPQRAMRALQRYSWPGNVRELENIIERAVISSEVDKLRIDMPVSFEVSQHKRKTLEELERSYILEVLQSTFWKINGPNGAADYLGIHPETLRSRIKKLKIRRTEPL
jgi:transcriptional regulator with GAF, ATPase, and Fis domain